VLGFDVNSVELSGSAIRVVSVLYREQTGLVKPKTSSNKPYLSVFQSNMLRLLICVIDMWNSCFLGSA
jgi:hypothetical protein